VSSDSAGYAGQVRFASYPAVAKGYGGRRAGQAHLSISKF